MIPQTDAKPSILGSADVCLHWYNMPSVWYKQCQAFACWYFWAKLIAYYLPYFLAGMSHNCSALLNFPNRNVLEENANGNIFSKYYCDKAYTEILLHCMHCL